MTLEQQLADAAALMGLARDDVAGLSGVADAQITRVGDRYDQIIANGKAGLWVDQRNGDDTAPGTEAAPLKSIQAAIDLVPQGGWLDITLVGNYHVSTPILIGRRAVLIRGATGVKPVITFERGTEGSATVYRVVAGFVLSSAATMLFHTVRLEIPELGSFHPYTLANAGLFSYGDDWGHGNVVVRNSELVIPATPFCWMFNATSTWRFISYLNTYPGAITNPYGRLFHDQPNTAGVSAHALPWLVTNLTTV